MRHTALVLYRNTLERERVLSRLSVLPYLELQTCRLDAAWQAEEAGLAICYCRDLPSAFRLKQTRRMGNLLVLCPVNLASMMSLLEDASCRVCSLESSARVLEHALDYLLHERVRTETTAEHSVYLTRREKEVIELLISGQDNQQIASALGISVTTVIAHKKHMFMKSGVHSSSQLVVWAMLTQLSG
ncbi:MAG: response regulator transcription factor [Sphaerochaeta sp.]|uniref:helix-turn-helix transcriptional regulator n=1 Tax=Sphaerochaeta sp. TaxID=1972642 RepID=UPI003D0A8247